MLQRILEWIEPEDVYTQAELPKHARSFRMRCSDAFYKVFHRLNLL